MHREDWNAGLIFAEAGLVVRSPTTVPPSIPPQASDPAPGPDQTSFLIEHAHAYEPALRGYLRTKFPSVDPDDVVQESYLKVLKSRAVGGIASVKAYFFAVARNTACDLFRRNQIYSETAIDELPDWQVLDGGSDAAEDTNTHERHQLIVHAMASLPARCREVFALAVLHGQSNAEIAARLGLKESTVRGQMARGLKKCVEYLRERGERP